MLEGGSGRVMCNGSLKAMMGNFVINIELEVHQKMPQEAKVGGETNFVGKSLEGCGTESVS